MFFEKHPILTVSLQDADTVTVLSTVHDNLVIRKWVQGMGPAKLKCVEDYNSFMGSWRWMEWLNRYGGPNHFGTRHLRVYLSREEIISQFWDGVVERFPHFWWNYMEWPDCGASVYVYYDWVQYMFIWLGTVVLFVYVYYVYMTGYISPICLTCIKCAALNKRYPWRSLNTQ